MSISIQNLNDVIVALVTVVGIAVVISGALIAASAFFQRGKARTGQPVAATVPAQQPTQLDDARELVLR
jgi:hypothetical protein